MSERGFGYELQKRAFDVVVAGLGLVALSPVLLCIAVAIRLRMGAPVLFRQLRPGRDGRPFEILKFRTMTDRRSPDGSLLPDAERLTWIGRMLRRSSLDELPELVNVVRGDMSLVGPRPLLMDYLELYTPEQARRHEVRPGITGWAQVNGRNATTWDERFAHDLYYVEHRSLRLDLKILERTAARVLTGAGVSEPGEATRARFTGASASERPMETGASASERPMETGASASERPMETGASASERPMKAESSSGEQ